MNRDWWVRIEELFEQAIGLPIERRDAFLAKACADDHKLRREVESLLAHDNQAPTKFMRPPPIGDSFTVDHDQDDHNRDLTSHDGGAEGKGLGEGEDDDSYLDDPRIGRTIGHYRIERVIAAGGMGTVYLAEQQQPRRMVALKIMRAGITSRSALRRFEHESQILARLHHPNIAQVYMAGTHREDRPTGGGVPYFAMEYILDARTITARAADHELSTRERLRLFTQVCDAVEHGHQKGIIHRDLKPGNILVDPGGQVKVIDFGVARATDSDVAVTTMQTDVGQLIGTLQYMSPEQCDADPNGLDIRSDVYALGVVLYELLCGRPPYDLSAGSILSGTRAIRETPPTRPSTIKRALRGDVETIVLKALEKSREKRYASAGDLGQDIRRHLNGEPIAARPPTAWTRTYRWVGRHPAMATTVICLGIAMAIAAGIYIALWLTWSRPYEIRLTEDRREARLLSAAGRLLHTWRTDITEGITGAELIERPAELGGGFLALIGYHSVHGNPFPGALCAFDVRRDYDKPIWHRGMVESDVLPDLLARNRTAQQFGVSRIAGVFDLFSERPGPEIVTIFAHEMYSQRLIRIYDLRGELLYQIWQDGAIADCYWMAPAGLLVVAAEDCRWYWKERGYPNTADIYPKIVFAIRPEIGFIAQDYLRYEAGDDPLSPVWCKHLLPPDRLSFQGTLELGVPRNPHDSGRSVAVYVGVLSSSDKPQQFWWVIEEHGDRVPGSLEVSDAYRLASDLPDPKDFHLGYLPPPPNSPREDDSMIEESRSPD